MRGQAGELQDRFDDFVRPALAVVHVLGLLLGLGRREVLAVAPSSLSASLTIAAAQRWRLRSRTARRWRIHEADRGQAARLRSREEPVDQMVVIGVLQDDRRDHRRHGHVGEVVAPADAVRSRGWSKIVPFGGGGSSSVPAPVTVPPYAVPAIRKRRFG